VRTSDFSNHEALSLTPCISGVLREREILNRFNGFPSSFLGAETGKPLKRFIAPRRSIITPLKHTEAGCQ
jgi:hypothetical protein